MTKDLTGGNPLKVILFFTLPLVLGNLFQQFYALADTIIVGRFCGVSALASVGSTGSINYLILGFVIGICNGFAIPIAQLFGARDYSDLRRHVANAAWLCIAFSVVLTITTVTLTRPLLVLMQTPEDILDGAVIYIGWIFASIPFIFLYNMVASIMRALGDCKTPLYFLILTSALNIGLDLLFIVPFKMGILGAALATDISQNALTAAQNAQYDEESLSKLPPLWKSKYFDRTVEPGIWTVKQNLKSNVIFRTFNLMDPIRFQLKFDVIFCRNVMIYFDQATKNGLIERFYNATAPGGYLLIGHSESLNKTTTRYNYIMPATYRK